GTLRKGGLTMRKVYALGLSGLSLFLVWPVLAAEPTDRGMNVGGCRTPADYIKKTVTVEIQGKLRQIDITHEKYPGPLAPAILIMGWEVTANGKSYRLEFGNDQLRQLAWKLEGQTVMLTGRLEQRKRRLPPYTMPDGTVIERSGFLEYQAVVVTSLQA